MNQSRNTSNIKIDRELQEKLYTNIALLNMVHPPSEDFKAVFKKDMFAKSNKAAFLQVVHYLLNVLNPTMAKEKLITWPTCNIISRENKFRSEVLQYLNELNSLYENANLPTMMSSHLLAPGGYRFINFMYKLSQLVMFEDLSRKYPNEILQSPRLGKNEVLNKKVCENIVKLTEGIHIENNLAIEKFEKRLKYFEEEAEKTVAEKNNVNVELRIIQKNIDEQKHRLSDLKISDEEIDEKIKILLDKSKVINKINETYNECKNMLLHLKEYNEAGHLLDPIKSIKVLNDSLKRQLSELPEHTIPELEIYLNEVEKKEKELKVLEKRQRNEHESLVEAMNNSRIMLNNIIAELEE